MGNPVINLTPLQGALDGLEKLLDRVRVVDPIPRPTVIELVPATGCEHERRQRVGAPVADVVVEVREERLACPGEVCALLVQAGGLDAGEVGVDQLDIQADAVPIALDGGEVLITTDGFTVQPLEFPGGNIGSLAVHGTVNDLAVCGARPRWLSAGFILEEGFVPIFSHWMPFKTFPQQNAP